jgi:hypothetical protein
MNRHALALALAALTGMTAAHAQDTHTTTYQTTQGPLTVNWGQPAPRDAGPPPPWEQMDVNGDGAVDEQEAASGYILLANDFKFADSNRNGRVSETEYSRWSSRP